MFCELVSSFESFANIWCTSTLPPTDGLLDELIATAKVDADILGRHRPNRELLHKARADATRHAQHVRRAELILSKSMFCSMDSSGVVANNSRAAAAAALGEGR